MSEREDMLLRAFLDSAQPAVKRLRTAGWVVEVIVRVNDDGTKTVAIECNPNDPRRPIEAEPPDTPDEDILQKLVGVFDPPTTCPENCALKGTGTPHSQHVTHTVPTGTEP